MRHITHGNYDGPIIFSCTSFRKKKPDEGGDPSNYRQPTDGKTDIFLKSLPISVSAFISTIYLMRFYLFQLVLLYPQYI